MKMRSKWSTMKPLFSYPRLAFSLLYGELRGTAVLLTGQICTAYLKPLSELSSDTVRRFSRPDPGTVCTLRNACPWAKPSFCCFRSQLFSMRQKLRVAPSLPSSCTGTWNYETMGQPFTCSGMLGTVTPFHSVASGS